MLFEISDEDIRTLEEASFELAWDTAYGNVGARTAMRSLDALARRMREAQRETVRGSSRARILGAVAYLLLAMAGILGACWLYTVSCLSLPK